MQRTVWTFGLIAGAILSVMMVVTMVLLRDTIGIDRGEVVGYTTMVLSFLLVYFGVRSYRDNVMSGQISFGRAFVVGAAIVAVAGACYTATWEVLYYKLEPQFADRYAAYTIERAKASGASQADIDAKLAEMKKFAEMYKNPVFNAAVTFLEPLPVGLVIALLSAGVLRRRRTEAPFAAASAA